MRTLVGTSNCRSVVRRHASHWVYLGRPFLGDLTSRARLHCIGKTTNQLSSTGTDFSGEARQNLSPLGDETLGDLCIEFLTGARRSEQYGALIAGMPRPRHISLALQSRDHAAGSALVEVQLAGQFVKGATVATNQHVECVALGDGDVVGADSVAIAKLID